MHLTPTERDRLLLLTAAELARARRGRGLLLNVPEASAVVADAVAEAARDGCRLAEAVERGRLALGRHEVLPGVADVVREVKVEAVFDDGTRLAVVPAPFGPSMRSSLSPGAILTAAGPPQAADTKAIKVILVNEGTVPISVTSHFHFLEANPRLKFDRRAAWGCLLAVPAGTVQRFDTGVAVPVRLVPFGGRRVIVGFAGLVDGPLDAPGAVEAALDRARACGYLDTAAVRAEQAP